jgi:hypothetical protein
MFEWIAVNTIRVLSRKTAFQLLPVRSELDRVS